MQISVDKKRCPQNHSCPAIQVCRVSAIRQYGVDAPTIDQEKCTKCKKCLTLPTDESGGFLGD